MKVLKLNSLLVCLFIISLVGRAEEYDIFLCIGQSNMAGRGEISQKVSGEVRNSYLLNSNGKWSPAKNPFNAHSSVRKKIGIQGVSPIYSFAKTVAEASGDRKLGFVVNARGGTRIDEWQPGKGLYEDAVSRCKLAMKSGKLKAILWHQGEGNRMSTEYAKLLEALVASLRKDLNAPDVLFILGEINGEAVVNDQMAIFTKNVENTAMVLSDGLSAIGSHFDTAGQIELGKRYAKAYLKHVAE